MDITQKEVTEMKTAFTEMEQEIKEQAAEIEQLKENVVVAEEKLSEREEASAKMIDQMEELHENLAELDMRFERSESHNKQLQQEKEELRREMEKEISDLKKALVSTERRHCSQIDEMTAERTMIVKQKDYIIKAKIQEIEKLTVEKANTENELKESKEDLSKVSQEYEKYQTETNNKMEKSRLTFKTSLEQAIEPVASYIDKNKGSKTPIKKTKSYRLLKTVHSDLKNVFASTTNGS
ncbi:golgin subfamily A member 6-like protein 25 isoform X1 [Hydractinia symbiolongicarpus]|uniref:golgin subfamily A member 6-like protein 25 isoform X1 n=1 Tax=Hydractinia symbiolongicarpus TaxID=13093 RepID=UPI0025504A5D|nr:golgin subfamily A member 6-like protein 25 isoform X1 [Hydractinia symbiolongicarpus]XP_057290253.1 golgin subfamily A member 6-like protein 25 isoform X1 [Hydractinia symbiolongicarpus]XP_057290254.1 golgin subfamily A member 6-like protein 25 isoform X1 [Hydractinia symbiolongicarpus]XP_057290255.1 golgin subfamily A member 6-like protein 25 isoform X1 [Hydractinia symbiolongicarpus]